MRIARGLFAVCALLLAVQASAQPLDEARVKAKLAYNVARFTQWPDQAFAAPNEPLLLCVLQRSEKLAAAFAELEGLSIAGHTVKVVLNPPKALKGCHLVFMHESVENAGVAALGNLNSLPILTIGDVERFAARGGMVELINVNDAVRFDVNLKALRGAQLALSSQVLRLARHVIE